MKDATEYNHHLDKVVRDGPAFANLVFQIAQLSDLQKVEIAAQLLLQMNEKYGEETNYATNDPAGILEDIREGNLQTAITKANGSWEPPERGDAWSGGFADNH